MLDLCTASMDVRFVGRGGWRPLATTDGLTLTFEESREDAQCGWTETESGTIQVDPSGGLTGEIRLDRVPLATDQCAGSSQRLTVTGTLSSVSTCDDLESCVPLSAGDPGPFGFRRPAAWANLADWGS